MKNKLELLGPIAMTVIIGLSAIGYNQPTNNVTPEDKTALGNAIAAAQALIAGTATSADDTDITSRWWAPCAT
ncbi:MAG: hypothetical protein FWB78_10935 [Treponema sp.]|nr:hypothetical protein [Treponema sp.]